MKLVESIRRSLYEAERVAEATRNDDRLIEAVAAFAERAATPLEAGGRILACGNGGSLSDAMHFAAECSGRFRAERSPLSALALSDPVAMSAIANDYGFEEVFARQVEALARPGDLLVLLSTSGDSPNLVRAAETARARQVATVALLGRGGGKLHSQVDLPIVVPGATTSDKVQEVHIQLLHACIEALEVRLGVSNL